MTPKITLIGAGSAVFARQIMTDIMAIDGLDAGEFALVDIDSRRLELASDIARYLVSRSGKQWTVAASTERCDVLAGSDFIVNMIEVAGLATVQHDYEIPLKYGVDQCIGDTVGPGGIFKALRTGPEWLDILHDCERLCPSAWVLNYSNPMSILTYAGLVGSRMRIVGLCHSVQHTSRQLAGYLGVPYEGLQFRCGGINHAAWFTELTSEGDDLYPRLLELSHVPEIYEQDPIRFDVLQHFGAFVTESSGHFSEYVPYYRKRPDLIARYMREGYRGESGYYARNWSHWRALGDQSIREMLDGTRDLSAERSVEYAATIIESVTLDRPRGIYGNVRNSGMIANLPDGCIEVACEVSRAGVSPCFFGTLPEQLAALNRSHMAIHTLMVDALLNRDRVAARYALLLDPLTAAVCSPAEIEKLFDEMWEAESDYLRPFKETRSHRARSGESAARE